MSDASVRHPITLKKMVLRIEGMESVTLERDLEYASSGAGPLVMDVYRPANPSNGRLPPVVLIVAGYPDVGVPRVLGCAFKEMEMCASLGRLLAASGMAAVAYTTRNPVADIHAVLEHLGADGRALGVDAARTGLWAVSGNVPVALATLAHRQDGRIRAAVLSNGFMFDADGSSAVADAARTYGFANAADGMSARDLPHDVPLFVMRAGRDENAGLNATLDRFVQDALACNLPVTAVNYPDARHAFELDDETAISRRYIVQMLAFMQLWLKT